MTSREQAAEKPCWHARTSVLRMCATRGERPAGCSKRPAFSPAQPWRAKTRLFPNKAAASCHFIRGGWDDPNCAQFLTRPPTGTPRRAICPGEGLPILHTSLKGSGRGCPLLRASSDHCFTVGALRARRAPGRSLLILLRPRVARARGSSQLPHPPFFSILLGPIDSTRMAMLLTEGIVVRFQSRKWHDFLA
jgi:hypothetical protein